ncbi:MAG: 4Fe-4S binding protein [Prevotellaceae bacterium]|nr:4Fe-4S binding protein [Prevotellaceae bacterium]
MAYQIKQALCGDCSICVQECPVEANH